MKLLPACLVALILVVSARAEIVVPATTPIGKFVRATADIPQPAEPGDREVELAWTVDDDCEAVAICDGEELLIVGPEGAHVVALSLRVSRFETLTVVERDKEHPDDITRAKLVDRRIRVDSYRETWTAEFTIGKPTPPPVPPPVVPPDPPPVVVEEGARDVYVIRESSEDTAAFAMMVNMLRSGSEAKYWLDKGHRLIVIDDDEQDGRGNPAGPLTRFSAILAETPRPTLIICDRKTSAVIAKAKIDPQTTAANVTEAVRRTGG